MVRGGDSKEDAIGLGWQVKENGRFLSSIRKDEVLFLLKKLIFKT